jgi:biopolymer transport protein ExbD
MKFRLTDESRTRPEGIVLINLTFLLCALVAIAMHFESARTNERIKLPRLALARPSGPSAGEFVVDIRYPRRERDRSGTSTAPLAVVGGSELPLNELEPKLQQIRQGLERTGSRSRNQAAVILRAEQSVPYHDLQRVVLTCQTAGFSRLALQSLSDQ